MMNFSNKHSSPFVDIKNLSYHYEDGKLALDSINLSVQKGEFLTVFGPNGCGKSTLLQCIAGVLKTNGEVSVNNQDPSLCRVGFVFQDYREGLLPWRTCLDNIAFPLELKGVSKKERHEQAKELVNELNIDIDLYSRPHMNSGGQQQLIAIARALILSPDILLLDEPTSSLDINMGFFLRDKLENIWKKTNITTIHVTHSIEEVLHLSSRVVLFSQNPGKIISNFDNELPRPRRESIYSLNAVDIREKIEQQYISEMEAEK